MIWVLLMTGIRRSNGVGEEVSLCRARRELCLAAVSCMDGLRHTLGAMGDLGGVGYPNESHDL